MSYHFFLDMIIAWTGAYCSFAVEAFYETSESVIAT